VPGGVASERDADPGREDHRRDRQLDRRREADEELAQDGLVVDDARAEVAAKDVGQIVQVLLPERVVEAQVFAHRRDALGGRMLAQDRRGGIPGQEMDEGEQDDRQPEQDRDHTEQSSDDEAEHLAGPASPREGMTRIPRTACRRGIRCERDWRTGVGDARQAVTCRARRS
jgi:hypothetical protein